MMNVAKHRYKLLKWGVSAIMNRTALQVSTVPYSTSGQIVNSEMQTPSQKEVISKAMKAYLRRAKEHDEFMKQQKLEFEIGRKHLANMMGMNPDTFTQEDIDKSIEYLLPSGLFEPLARPLMKPPEEIFPKRKAAEFDETGRPHHHLFYTNVPNLYQLLHDCVVHLNNLNVFEDKMIRRHLQPDPNQKLDFTGYVWISKEDLEKQVLETILDVEYTNLIQVVERLSEHPFSYRIKDFILKYRYPPMLRKRVEEIPIPQIGEDGRQYTTTTFSKKKQAIAHVTVRAPGTGKININGKDISFFKAIQSREQVIFPLLFTELHEKVDVEATVTSGGPTGQAIAIRYGLSRCIRSFVDSDMLEKMRVAGLLQRDVRRKERKKPGQEGARRKYTWKKR